MVVASHIAHELVNETVGARDLCLTAHSALETYSVLTRLPSDARLRPADAALLIEDRFPSIIALGADESTVLVSELARLAIAGGAVYDALIAVTARSAGATLVTRDRRAEATYRKLGIAVELIG